MLVWYSLTRRFSVLRNSSGEPIGLDELKSKLAEQRARGFETQVTEEEEDMILEALGRFHTRSRSRGKQQAKQSTYDEGEAREASGDADADDADLVRQSVRSSNSATTPSLHGAASITSMSSTKGSQTSRRMSNNLFGSGKFRDQAYFLRTSPRRSGRGTGSIAQADSNTSMSTVGSALVENSTSMYSDSQSLRPVTPEGSTYTFSGSAPSSPGNTSILSKDRGSRSITGDQHSEFSSSLSKRLSKTLSPDGLRRASLALDQAIRELEEEGDDEIVMERSPITHVAPSLTNGLSILNTAVELDWSSPATAPSELETGTAVSSDDPMLVDEGQRTSPYPASRTTSPTPRLPGYIPGMPRPMTPRETASFDIEDLTPSATPRATSPRLPGINTQERQRNGNKPSSPTSEAAESPVLGRRRPISPLSGPAYQPLTTPTSRPSTPSNVTWNMSASPNGTPQKAHGRNGSVSAHSRSGSTTSINEQTTEALERAKSVTRSLRSPALPDSPWVDSGHTNGAAAGASEFRPPSAMSGMELGSPIQVHNMLRSPTPTYNGNRSPISPTFTDVNGFNDDTRSASRRSSKQTQPTNSNTFSFNQPNALLFSPIANSSRSSLESAGSSYHSWDEDHKTDRLHGLFTRLDPDSTPWHDISPDKSGTSTAGTSPYDATETEDAVRMEIGLSKVDFVAIQDKLVTAALTKAATPENRRPGSIRKRRPSTSQSNYSFTGESRAVNSTPQPQPQTQMQSSIASPRSTTSDHVAKANALLNAVVDSIESPRIHQLDMLPPEEPTLTVPAPADIEQSSPMRRNRALAEALFGSEELDARSSSPPQISIMPDMGSSDPDEDEPLQSVVSPTQPLHMPKRSDSLRRAAKVLSPISPSTATMPPSPGGLMSPLSPASNLSPVQLAFEVQRRAEAATAALRKSPSIPKMNDGHGTLPRKRISPNKISAPTLVSASTSVDAIPLRSPTSTPTPTSAAQQGSSKIGSRFKKLRGTIRAKPQLPNGEEITPFPLELRNPNQEAHPHPAGSSHNLGLRTDPIPIVNSAGAAEPTRLKAPAPLPSPPASATPGLKGFMARFRKQRAAAPETLGAPSLVVPSHPEPYMPSSAKSTRSIASSGSSPDHPYGAMPHSAPALQTAFRSMSPIDPPIPPAQSPTPKPPQLPQTIPPLQLHSDEDALKQLFDAASNLGLDQAALNDLIARSPSVTSSKSTAWTKLRRATSTNESRRTQVPIIRERATPDSVRSPPMSEGRPSVETYSPRPSTELKSPPRKSQDTPRRSPHQEINPKAIVRRTIIFPSDSRISTVDMSALMRKQSTSRRRASVGSNRSVHDRVPTPPPPHRGGGRRYSTDVSPPVPQLPQALSVHNEHMLAVPSPMDKSNSAYDSLYEMYSGDSKGQLLSADSPGASGSQVPDGLPEAGQALEVIEMANGETIWSIVNGLRDDDGESFYGDRASFYSEYSMKEESNVKVFFKEHERKSSKGSVNSLLSRKKSQQQPKGTARPETKVFFSSSAQIGRLIENLSRGTDAGSFNITTSRSQAHPGHSVSSSLGSEADIRWTVEERLEHMLGSMGAA
ncbi:hypothetical protein C8Q80DRAFT_1219125 [Daedaleopsis nitida]|nr:hypothetical protein C8Q80DRAFT_1219125 [Daedaleopsis nitida]